MKDNVLGLKAKLLGIIFILLALFLAASVFIILRIQNLNEITEDSNSNSASFIQLLEARVAEKTFFNVPGEVAFKENVEFIHELKETLQNSITEETDVDHLRMKEGLLKKVEIYQNSFKEVYILVEEKGFDENSGLRGELRKAIQEVEAELKKLNRDDILVSLLMCRRHEKDYLLRGTIKYVDRFDKESNTLKKLLGRLDNGRYLSNLINDYQAKFHKLTDNDIEINKKTESFVEEITKLEPEMREFQSIIQKEASEATLIMNRVIIIAVVSLIIFGSIIGFVFSHNLANKILSLTKSLNSSSTQITSASTQLAETSQNIANGASEQASGIEETSSALEELTSIVKTNMENSQQTNLLAEKSAVSSETGFKRMEVLLASMEELNASSDEIKKVVSLIDSIAFQTNILALNASVEAARAGEAGMGFAVVADEVKSLANRSIQAAKETSDMIEDSLNKIGTNLEVVQEIAVLFKEILESGKKVNEMSKEVELSSKQQNEGIDQINKTIQQFDLVVQNNASAAEESASSAEELASQSETLKNVVDVLVQVVSGKKSKGLSLENNVYMNHENSIRLKEPRKETRLLPEKTKRINKPEEIIPFEDDSEFSEF